MRFGDSSKWISCGKVVVYLWVKRWLAGEVRGVGILAINKNIFASKPDPVSMGNVVGQVKLR